MDKWEMLLNGSMLILLMVGLFLSWMRFCDSITEPTIIEKEVEVIRYQTEWKEVMRTTKYYDCMGQNGEYRFESWNTWMWIDWEEVCIY